MDHPPYLLDHEGLTCWLQPQGARGNLTALAGCGLLPLAVGISAASGMAGSIAVLIGGITIGVLGLSTIVYGIGLRAPLRLRCTARVLSWAPQGVAGWTRPARTMSLLDLDRVVVVGAGWLVLEPSPGPLDRVWIDARGHEIHRLQILAEALTERAAGAEPHRGDHPGAEAWAVSRLGGGHGAGSRSD